MFSPPKGVREREVPLPDFVSVALAENLRHSPATDVTLRGANRAAPNARGHCCSSTARTGRCPGPTTHNGWKPAARAAGIQSGRRNGFHSLRHHYAGVLLDDGVSIRAVSAYLGHHDPGFTLRTYAHLMPEAEDRTRAAIDAAYGAAADSVRTETGG